MICKITRVGASVFWDLRCSQGRATSAVGAGLQAPWVAGAPAKEPVCACPRTEGLFFSLAQLTQSLVLFSVPAATILFLCSFCSCHFPVFKITLSDFLWVTPNQNPQLDVALWQETNHLRQDHFTVRSPKPHSQPQKQKNFLSLSLPGDFFSL